MSPEFGDTQVMSPQASVSPARPVTPTPPTDLDVALPSMSDLDAVVLELDSIDATLAELG